MSVSTGTMPLLNKIIKKIFYIQSKPGFTHTGTKSGIKSAKIPKIGIGIIYVQRKKTFI